MCHPTFDPRTLSGTEKEEKIGKFCEFSDPYWDFEVPKKAPYDKFSTFSLIVELVNGVYLISALKELRKLYEKAFNLIISPV